MKKILSIGLLGLFLGACSSQDVPENTGEVSTPNRFMAISIVSNTTSRADYATTTEDEEVKVKDNNIVLFFFKADGSPFVVDDTQDEANQQSYLENTEFKNWSTTTTDADGKTTNLAESQRGISDLLAVFSNKEGETPSKVVALLNNTVDLTKKPDGTARGTKQFSLADVKELVVTAGSQTDDNGTYYVMSNSVYKDAAGVVYATDIPASSIATTETLAQEHPVNIYVERVVAKVSLENKLGAEGKISLTDTEIKYAGSDETLELSVQIEGWQLFNTTQHSLLLKNFDGITDAWANAESLYRSFWAVTPEAYKSDITNNTQKVKWSEIEKNTKPLYPFENTLTPDENATPSEDINTNVIFATKIVDTDGNAADLTYWLSKYYKCVDLQKAIANYLSNSLFTYDESAGTWSPIQYTDINFESLSNGYQVKPKVTGSWYSRGSTTALSSTDLADILNAVPPARIWKDGKCYYYTPIKHTIGTTEKNGIVRNHWYKLSVDKITGLGTPVYEPTDEIDPTKPTSQDNQEWFLDAQIVVQSWRMVNQSIELTSE